MGGLGAESWVQGMHVLEKWRRGARHEWPGPYKKLHEGGRKRDEQQAGGDIPWPGSRVGRLCLPPSCGRHQLGIRPARHQLAGVRRAAAAGIARRGTQRRGLQPGVAQVGKGAGVAHAVLVQPPAGALPSAHHALQVPRHRQQQRQQHMRCSQRGRAAACMSVWPLSSPLLACIHSSN